MAARPEGEETQAAESTPKRPRSKPRPVETPPAEPVPADETPPAGETEPVTGHTSPQTCVWCNQVIQVDPNNLAGGLFIAEPALSIHHYVCEGCNDAETGA